MSEQIQVVGLTTTDINGGVQYTLLTKTGDKYYDYVFTPDRTGRYTLRTNPTVDKQIEAKPLHPLLLSWQGQQLLLKSTSTIVLYNTVTRTFADVTHFFHQEEDILPKRWTMIIPHNPEAVMSFIAQGKSVVYADSWEHLPQVIPEDVIILGIKKFPIKDIVLHLPQRTKAVVVKPEILE
ncbi:MAG: hypothetical protein IJZ68_07565 [Bacteroidaceae bacterium]|nr:hypothetical protein [Bacteroidaceae bacterium]